MFYDFSFISDIMTRTSLEIMQIVLNDHNLWDYVKNFSEESFMFSNSDELKIISNDVRNDFHSGASFGLTLRSMQYIMLNGFEKFKEQIIQDEMNRNSQDYQKNYDNMKIYDNMSEKFIETYYSKCINNI